MVDKVRDDGYGLKYRGKDDENSEWLNKGGSRFHTGNNYQLILGPYQIVFSVGESFDMPNRSVSFILDTITILSYYEDSLLVTEAGYSLSVLKNVIYKYLTKKEKNEKLINLLYQCTSPKPKVEEEEADEEYRDEDYTMIIRELRRQIEELTQHKRILNLELREQAEEIGRLKGVMSTVKSVADTVCEIRDALREEFKPKN